MIVIPPSSEHLTYFTGLAENVWENSLTDKAALCKELLSENRTLVVTCDINNDNDTTDILTVNLHYRYLNAELYCFIEEVYTNV